MRVLVVDDEPLAQKALISILEKRKEIESFDVANDATEALERLSSKSYELMILDVVMPELSGMQLVDQLKRQGHSSLTIIFVTAHDEYASMAFQVNAVDYVLKPFSKERMCEALNRAALRTHSDRAGNLIESSSQMQRLPVGKPPRIAIKSKGKVLYMELVEVSVVLAEGAYVRLQQGANSYLLRGSISAITKKLEPYGFVRIHRSVLVNRALVEEVKPYTSGEYGLRIKGGKEYTVSRGYKQNLLLLAEFWIGSSAYFGTLE
jgi:two-component system, LytTR family, response regulator